MHAGSDEKASISPNHALENRQLADDRSPIPEGMPQVEIPTIRQQEITQKDTVVNIPLKNSANVATSEQDEREQDEREHEGARRKSQVAARDRLAKLLMEREEAETAE
jgi:hypothetical protein